jgi:protein-disulfide isomerase
MKKFVLVFFLAVWMMAPLNVSAADKTAPISQDALGEAIRTYLLENPDVMAEVFENTQKYLIAEDEKRQSEMLKKNSDALYNDERDFSIGSPDAPITIVEFFDYNCGYCKRAFPDIMKLTQKNPDVRVVFKEFPILGPASEQAARVALASKGDGKYFAIHQGLLNARGSVSGAALSSLIEKHGLNADEIVTRGKNKDIDAHIKDVRNLAQSLGVSGTPAFIIDNQLFSGALSYDDMQSLIDEIRGSSN